VLERYTHGSPKLNKVSNVGPIPWTAGQLKQVRPYQLAWGRFIVLRNIITPIPLPVNHRWPCLFHFSPAKCSAVFPLSEAMAARFQAEGYGDNITIDSIGSGAGFERFCVEGETDISNAIRPIKDSEVELCQAIGRDPIEFRVGTDALAVVVSQDNDFVDGATFEELALIFSTAENWSYVNPEWPEETIQRFIPGTDSGTFDFFVEEVFDENEEPILGA